MFNLNICVPGKVSLRKVAHKADIPDSIRRVREMFPPPPVIPAPPLCKGGKFITTRPHPACPVCGAKSAYYDLGKGRYERMQHAVGECPLPDRAYARHEFTRGR